MEEYVIRSLSFSYPNSEVLALKDIDLDIHSGDFIVLSGPSGSGKSTLLRHMKTILTPAGTRKGSVLFEGKTLDETDNSIQAEKIGFIQQDPENQIVTDKVWHELAFGLENLGYDNKVIRRRVAEMSSFFGIEDWFYKNVNELSGGQKQILNLAAIMCMQPNVLIADEPTCQLDPIAASEFFSVLGKINRELGTTVIVSEHRLDEAYNYANRSLISDKGSVIYDGTPDRAGGYLKENRHDILDSMPAPIRVWSSVESDTACPVNVREGRKWLAEYVSENKTVDAPCDEQIDHNKESAIIIKDLHFRYSKDGKDIIDGLDIEIEKGRITAVLGGNGAGKSTLLKLISGSLKAQRGDLTVKGRTAYLPQDPRAMFLKKTVRQELFADHNKNNTDDRSKLIETVNLFGLSDLLDRHPYDISGGEQQRLALALLYLDDPDILLLDEPTKSLDSKVKHMFASVVAELCKKGITILMVSHDVEFCAEFTDKCALLFQGRISVEDTPKRFFCGNHFYTTAADRMSRGIINNAVTVDDIIASINGRIEHKTSDTPEAVVSLLEPPGRDKKHLPLWRVIISIISGAAAIVLFIIIIRSTDLSSMINSSGITGFGRKRIAVYIAFIASMIVLTLSSSKKSERPKVSPIDNGAKTKLSKRTIFAAVIILLLIPATLYFGSAIFDNRKYYFISLLIILEVSLPFILIFESRSPKAREIVILAVLCAIAVAGRAVFFMLPEFKPIVAVTVIAGIAFGGESGFLVGALSMLISDMMFSQGPWTPWQMFAMGIIGFLAGIIFKKGAVSRTRISICIYGALASIIIYGGIMNPFSAVFEYNEINKNIILTYYLTGLPVDLIRAAGTWVFLWIASEPMLDKLDRLKEKYGLMR